VYEQAPGNNVYPRLNLVTCPVTLATGGPAAHFGLDVVTAVAARIAGPASIEVHEKLGHFGPLEQPAEIGASVLSAFLRA
jgi:pimeloyl-ACP methyl ester carboxylesterase